MHTVHMQLLCLDANFVSGVHSQPHVMYRHIFELATAPFEGSVPFHVASACMHPLYVYASFAVRKNACMLPQQPQ
jgi:hypothetical protein